MSDIKLTNDWLELLAPEFEKPYMQKIKVFLQTEIKQGKKILPVSNCWFTALNTTSFANTKVVILGQDPYPTPGNAHGLSFSVMPNIPLPASLKNIFIELANDLGTNNTSGYLLPWAQQGVLLLNSVLTVQAHKPQAHQGIGWEIFTDRIISLLSEKQQVIFVLWGKYAQQKISLINTQHNKVIASPHPSPLSAHRGFFNSKPFSQINTILAAWHKQGINWQLK